jgi:hypothetical protein
MLEVQGAAQSWRWLPQSLMGRLALVMVAGVLVAQLAGNADLGHTTAHQGRAADVRTASQYLAHSASNAIRFFRSVPPNYRPLLIQQFREMGGTRFFVNLGTGASGGAGHGAAGAGRTGQGHGAQGAGGRPALSAGDSTGVCLARPAQPCHPMA